MLSSGAQKLIYDYLNLPFTGINGVRCPYFNNWKLRQRGQLRVLIGKGLPKDIVEEAKIVSLQYHLGLFDKAGHCCLHSSHSNEVTPEIIRKFLIDHNLGIDCSGFVVHVLHKHYLETKKINILRKIKINSQKNLLRLLIFKIRPVENIGVKTISQEINSQIILNLNVDTDFSKIKPGDFFVMLETGPQKKRNHIILVTESNKKSIKYAHARAWSTEGQYGHGVAVGEIILDKPGKNILEQTWQEKNEINEKNETFLEAKNAKSFTIRRLNF